MNTTTNALLDRSAELLTAVRDARVALAEAYGWPVAPTKPLEVPPASWVAKRDAAEQRLGRGIWKYFGD